MKFDWSKILILVMGLFIIFIVSMGVKMATSNQALYEDDYYELGEKYAERMTLEGAGEKVQARFDHSSSSVIIEFDSLGFVSQARFVNLADSKKDREINVPEKQLKQHIELPLNKLEAGLWIMEISGKVNGHSFFKKQQFTK